VNPNLALNVEVGVLYGITFRLSGEWRF